jgi:hypothetical protein
MINASVRSEDISVLDVVVLLIECIIERICLKIKYRSWNFSRVCSIMNKKF